MVGTVITRSIDVGQTVAASLQSPTLFLIGKDLTHMQVDTNVSEADVGDIRLGQDAYFTVQAFPGQTFHGKVWQIRRGPITVQNVVTYDVVVAFDNLDRTLFPGMTADTHIVIDGRDDVLRVPIPAVRFNPEGISALKSETPSAGATPSADTTPAEGERHARNRPEGERTPRPHGDGEQRAWNRSGGGPGGGGHGGGEGHGGRRALEPEPGLGPRRRQQSQAGEGDDRHRRRSVDRGLGRGAQGRRPGRRQPGRRRTQSPRRKPGTSAAGLDHGFRRTGRRRTAGTGPRL